MSTTRTELAQIGEFGFIERIKAQEKIQNSSTLKGIGDDAAVIAKDDKEYTLLSTDMLLEGVHFDLSYVPLAHLGYKAVAVNVSDIAAMNGTAQQITVGLGISSRFSVEALDELYRGIWAACQDYKVDLVGGDTTASRAGLVISVSVLGKVAHHKITYRNTAQLHDIICVTGDLGAAYLGLQILEREKQEFLANPNMQPQLDGKQYLVGRQLRAKARTDIIFELAEKNIIPTAMIDISDGLASELLHICTQSGLGATIFEDKIPIAQQSYDTAINDFQISPMTCALNGGEDYELLFTISPQDYEKIKYHDDISFIGYTQEAQKGIYLNTRNNQKVGIKAQGWVHFKE